MKWAVLYIWQEFFLRLSRSLTVAQLLLQVWTQTVVLLTELSQEERQTSLGATCGQILCGGQGIWQYSLSQLQTCLKPCGHESCPALPQLPGCTGCHNMEIGAHLVWEHHYIPDNGAKVFSISDIVKLELYKIIILWVYKVWVCVIAWIYKTFYFKSIVPFLGQICLENNGKKNPTKPNPVVKQNYSKWT